MPTIKVVKIQQRHHLLAASEPPTLEGPGPVDPDENPEDDGWYDLG